MGLIIIGDYVFIGYKGWIFFADIHRVLSGNPYVYYTWQAGHFTDRMLKEEVQRYINTNGGWDAIASSLRSERERDKVIALAISMLKSVFGYK